MQYPFLRQKEVADALWAYRNAVMQEARYEMRAEAFLNETASAYATANEMDDEGERIKAEVLAAYNALEAAIQAALNR